MSEGSAPTRVELRREGPNQPWGFRLQGGIDFPTALSIQSVNPGSIAERAGVMAGDAVLQINSRSSDELEHEGAKQEIMASGNNVALIIQRGAVKIWKPKVTPMSELKPREMNLISGELDPQQYVQRTSLAADKQEVQHIGSGYNRTARPFNEAFGAPAGAPPRGAGGQGGWGSGGAGGQTVPAIVNAQYNTPINLYSADNTVDTFQAQSNILTQGMQGLSVTTDPPSHTDPPGYLPAPCAPANRAPSPNQLGGGCTAPPGVFRRPSPVRLVTAGDEESIGAQKSAVLSELKRVEEGGGAPRGWGSEGGAATKQSRTFKMLRQGLGEEEEGLQGGGEPQGNEGGHDGEGGVAGGGAGGGAGGIRSVKAPVFDPSHHETMQAQHMVCKICGTLVIGVFVRIKGEPMHPECFKCCRCGKNLKNQGYFHIEGKMYCEPHAREAGQAAQGPDMHAVPVYR